ncbi:MAG: RagB/SusD family nutrient uptake outer membrane protein [Paludibacteraceae bacterium]|nr:RagB/SusD family nutrient uptake outer membrane protein [Paludibacteraceae bacterium]MBQ2190568.1 RagB/SusD family nutrient uptake outer membrane protein [Paludibacteraceae bacterium]MBQ2520904.1 RagB/SusD family nutrient uptake outer membrane protein [Paludibacteraceae bacterium]
MKKTVYILSLVVSALILNSCADSYLNQEPGGSSITEDQYKKMDNIIEGTVNGAYTLLYPFGGDHDAFGKRAIDMYGDMLCGDMAMRTRNYGWFDTDEQGQTYTRRAYFWAFYYGIIRHCNLTINLIDKAGHPSLTVDTDTLSEDAYYNGSYYAQMLALRGWAYAGLSRYFLKEGEIETGLAFPIYTEEDTKTDTVNGHERATAADVYLRIEEDLTTSLAYFQKYPVERENKIEMCADIVRVLLAYSYLNKHDNVNALKYATEAIDSMSYTLLPQAEVLTTGFNNIGSNNWIWGKDVTVENTTSLASFFGQCDIYSYSYAAAGDIKGIDMNLYDSIQAWDIRKGWWNKYYEKIKDKNSKTADRYRFAPDGKFYSATSKEIMGDRDWLSDDVYMRAEVPYLIAAEAAARNNDLTTAKNYLFAITDLRVITGQTAAYQAWQDGLVSKEDVLQAIRHNWRVELWGEGYGLQTFRRYGEVVKLGDNHRRSKKEIDPTTERVFTFELPTSEFYYNPALRQENASGANVLRRQY